jgi:hypothetical protein
LEEKTEDKTQCHHLQERRWPIFVSFHYIARLFCVCRVLCTHKGAAHQAVLCALCRAVHERDACGGRPAWQAVTEVEVRMTSAAGGSYEVASKLVASSGGRCCFEREWLDQIPY